MTPESVIDIAQQALQLTVLLAAPLLLPILIAGLVISMLQAATQINEVTLSFVPKLLILIVALVLAGPWMLQLVMGYTQRLFEDIPGLLF